MIDTHTHIYAAEFDGDREQVVADALAAGVTKMILPNENVASLPRLTQTRAQWPQHIEIAVGLHPEEVKPDFREQLSELHRRATETRPVAVGEIGIDLYWDKSYRAEQIEALDAQLDWCDELDLPFIIHCREALDEVLAVLGNHPRARGVMHCFTATVCEVERIRAVGDYHFGIGGVATFKKSTELRDALSEIGIQRILLETDAPYLAPAPHRGRRNQPAYLTLVRDTIATQLNLHPDSVDNITTQSAINLFKLTPQ